MNGVCLATVSYSIAIKLFNHIYSLIFFKETMHGYSLEMKEGAAWFIHVIPQHGTLIILPNEVYIHTSIPLHVYINYNNYILLVKQ